MEKKSKREIEKLVEAKAKGKAPKKVVATDDASPEAGEVDSRISKSYKWGYY